MRRCSVALLVLVLAAACGDDDGGSASATTASPRTGATVTVTGLDANFVTALDARLDGIGEVPVNLVLNAGRLACGFIDDQGNAPPVALETILDSQFQPVTGVDYTRDDAVVFGQLAITAYCPVEPDAGAP